MRRERALKVVLVLVEVLFTAVVYLLLFVGKTPGWRPRVRATLPERNSKLAERKRGFRPRHTA